MIMHISFFDLNINGLDKAIEMRRRRWGEEEDKEYDKTQNVGNRTSDSIKMGGGVVFKRAFEVEVRVHVQTCV